MTLLGPNGQPLQTFKKERPKALGPSFGQWMDREVLWNQMPGGAILNFDLSRLTMADFRAMRYHPTINLSLSVLTFMIHQVDWHLEARTTEIATKADDIIRPVWTRLVRALSQAFWAGYSPIAIEYENNVQERRVEISKFKDLVPEDCSVHWKEVEGSYAPADKNPPKFRIYDGIDQWGMNFPIPPENTIWYPLLMENGDMSGRKLLKSCFTPWYFSILVHLFANRYYERFGEPVPIGRAPFDDEFPVASGTSDAEVLTGKEAMEQILMSLRNRSVVTLPSSKTNEAYDYDIDYLESQMRGADFERYLTRLDEEISLGLFTPLLLYRTGSVGSNSLGVQHTKTWLLMLNALALDMKEYIDRYVLDRVKAYNWGTNEKSIKWIPHKMGREDTDTIRQIVQTLISKDMIKPDIDELGQALGMTLEEIQIVTEDPENPSDQTDKDNPSDQTATGNPRDTRPRTRPDSKTKGTGIKPAGNRMAEPRATVREISHRVRSQVDKAWRERRFGSSLNITMGFNRRFIDSLVAEGYSFERAEEIATSFYDKMTHWTTDAISLGSSEYSGPTDFMSLFDRVAENTLSDLSIDA